MRIPGTVPGTATHKPAPETQPNTPATWNLVDYLRNGPVYPYTMCAVPVPGPALRGLFLLHHVLAGAHPELFDKILPEKIGRASCREKTDIRVMTILIQSKRIDY